MVWTNIEDLSSKRVWGIIINEGGSSPPRRGRQEPPQGYKGKGKMPMSDRATASSQANLYELDDDQLLQPRHSDI